MIGMARFSQMMGEIMIGGKIFTDDGEIMIGVARFSQMMGKS